jgi:large subunit ribosomal protein L6
VSSDVGAVPSKSGLRRFASVHVGAATGRCGQLIVSRIGRQPIAVPDGVTVDIEPGMVSVKGPKGELRQAVSPDMKVTQSDGTLTVERPTNRGEHRALHGLTRSLIANMVVGVTDGYEKRLEIQGVGYRARLQGKALELSVGYSHPVSVSAPDGIEFEVPQPTQVVVRGIDKQLVGEIAARIRRTRPPEPYKGKGVRYAGEHVRRKVGKRA